jgi:phospholipid/cholesterol/gamma-HCH transport system substrate-binding protein
MRPFRERNPVPIGIAGILFIALLLAIGLNAGRLPFISSGHTVYAEFSDAAGLQPGNDVRIGGVLVGKVTSVKLDGNQVKVAMKVSGDHKIGTASHADIKIKTLLGQMYVDLTPAGAGSVPHNTISEADTSTPTGITQAFQGLGGRAGRINQQQLAHSFDVVAATFKDTPAAVRSSLTGLQRLSTTIASRNTELTALLAKANGVTTTLASRDVQIAELIHDSNLVLRTVSQQRAVIHNLLINTSALAKQLEGLVADNERVIGPALSELDGTLSILRANQQNLDETLHLAAPFIRDFTDTLGNGRWFETVLYNLTNAVGCLKIAGQPICPGSAGSGGTG